MASTLGGQRCCKAFGRAFGRAFVKLRTELRAELLQGFVRALVELCVLKFVTCILEHTPRGVLPKTPVVLGKALKSQLVLIFWLRPNFT